MKKYPGTLHQVTPDFALKIPVWLFFIAVSGFSIIQQPQRKFCFIAQSGAVLPPIFSVSAEISASCRISVSILQQCTLSYSRDVSDTG